MKEYWELFLLLFITYRKNLSTKKRLPTHLHSQFRILNDIGQLFPLFALRDMKEARQNFFHQIS